MSCSVSGTAVGFLVAAGAVNRSTLPSSYQFKLRMAMYSDAGQDLEYLSGSLYSLRSSIFVSMAVSCPT